MQNILKSTPIKITILFIMLLFLLFYNFITFASVTDAPAYYKEVIIEKGDTLYSIADEYNNGDMGNYTYARIIQDFNHYNNDAIYYGNNIIIPIYK